MSARLDRSVAHRHFPPSTSRWPHFFNCEGLLATSSAPIRFGGIRWVVLLASASGARLSHAEGVLGPFSSLSCLEIEGTPQSLGKVLGAMASVRQKANYPGARKPLPSESERRYVSPETGAGPVHLGNVR